MSTSNPSSPSIPVDQEKLARFAAEQAQRVFGKLPLLGPVTWLMMNQSHTRHVFLADLEWRVMPPLVLEQAKVFMNGVMPTCFASWAFLSEEAVARYRQPPHRLAPADWKSGDKVFLVDLVAPYGGAREALDDLKRTVLAGRTVHQIASTDAEVVEVVTL